MPQSASLEPAISLCSVALSVLALPSVNCFLNLCTSARWVCPICNAHMNVEHCIEEVPWRGGSQMPLVNVAAPTHFS